VVVWRWQWWWVGIEVLLPLIWWWVLPLLMLVEDVNGVLQFCHPRVLPIDVLPPSLSALDGCLSSHDGFLVLSKPLYLLLDPCVLPILDFDFVELSFALDDLQRWRWWRQVGVEVLVTSASLTGTCCGGGYVGLL
jgi:hypothetical protein